MSAESLGSRVREGLPHDGKRPSGYWEDYSNVRAEIGLAVHTFIEAGEGIPRAGDLKESGLKDIYRGVSRHESATYLETVADVLGLDVEDYTMEMIEAELAVDDPLPEYLDREFNEKDRTLEEVAEPLPTDGNTVNYWMDRLGIENRTLDRKPDGYWDEWSNIEQELEPVARKILEEEGRLPTKADLRDEGLSTVREVLKREHDMGVLDAYKKIFGIEGDKHKSMMEEEIKLGEPIEQYLVREYVNREDATLTEVAEPLDVGYDTLIRWKDELDLSTDRRPKGYWHDWDNVEDEVGEVAGMYIDQHGRLPTSDDLQDEGLSGVLTALDSYEEVEGLDDLYRQIYDMEEEKSRAMMEAELRLGEELEQFIRREYLEKDRRAEDVANELGSPKAVFTSWATRLGLGKSNNGIDWTDWSNYEEELKPYLEQHVEENGELPKKSDLTGGRFRGFKNQFRDGFDMSYQELLQELFDAEGYSRTMLETEIELDDSLEEFFMRELVYEGREKQEVAEDLGVGYQTLYNWMDVMDLDIERYDVTSEEDLRDLAQDDELVRDVLEAFGGNQADLADILSVVYGERIPDNVLSDIRARSELPEYMGDFVSEKPDIEKLADISAELMPLDEEGVVEEIFQAKAREYRHEILGPEPSREEVEEFVADIEGKLSEVKDR